MKQAYRFPALDLDHPAVSKTRRLQVMTPKVITSGMGKQPTSFWDSEGIAGGVSTSYVFPKEGVSGAYIAGLINSRLMAYVYRVLFGSLSLAGGYLRMGAPQLKALPVPDSVSVIEHEIGQMVESILRATGEDPKADTSKQLLEIDRIVYDAYELTSAEIAAVEGAT